MNYPWKASHHFRPKASLEVCAEWHVPQETLSSLRSYPSPEKHACIIRRVLLGKTFHNIKMARNTSDLHEVLARLARTVRGPVKDFLECLRSTR